MRTLAMGGAIALALVACGGGDDDAGDDARARVCDALDQVDAAAVAGDEDEMRRGFQTMLDAVEDSDDTELRTLVDNLGHADGDAAFASALLDLADHCD